MGDITDNGHERIQSFAFIVGIGLCMLLGLGIVCAGSSDRCWVGGVALADSVNPNTAPVESLVRLPGIGLVRATAIAAYRDRAHTGGVAFETANDLQAIRGIGPKTVEKIEKYLTFD